MLPAQEGEVGGITDEYEVKTTLGSRWDASSDIS